MSTKKLGEVLKTIRNGELASVTTIEEAMKELEAIREAARAMVHIKARIKQAPSMPWTERESRSADAVDALMEHIASEADHG